MLESSAFDFPTHPEIIKEYIRVIEQIEKERQRNPSSEPLFYPERDSDESSVLRKFEHEGLIRISSKAVSGYDPLGLDPYERTTRVRTVQICDLDKFLQYRKLLLSPPPSSADLIVTADGGFKYKETRLDNLTTKKQEGKLLKLFLENPDKLTSYSAISEATGCFDEKREAQNIKNKLGTILKESGLELITEPRAGDGYVFQGLKEILETT